MRRFFGKKKRDIGIPVLTEKLALEAYDLHYNKGMSMRTIAEQFTEQGNPCSHATVARYVQIIELEKKQHPQKPVPSTIHSRWMASRGFKTKPKEFERPKDYIRKIINITIHYEKIDPDTQKSLGFFSMTYNVEKATEQSQHA
jgi:hypothetical protein